MRDFADADGTGRASEVFDDNRLPQCLAHRIGKHARQHVRCAAGGKRHDDRHRPRRIIGREHEVWTQASRAAPLASWIRVLRETFMFLPLLMPAFFVVPAIERTLLFRLEMRELHHLGPFRRIRGNELGEFRRRIGLHLDAAEIEQAGL